VTAARPADPARTPLTVRAERPADVRAVRDVVAAAFGEEPVAPLLDALRESVAWLDLSFVAEQDGAVVGHVSFTRGWLDTPAELVEVLVLSPLSVRPDRQRSGVGTRLVTGTLRVLQQRPEPLVLLEGDPGYYSRLGFRPGGELGLHPPSVRVPAPAFQVVALPRYDGSRMRGALVYPDVWWRHDAVGLRPDG
jgi:putative acetyltransferase